MGWLGDSAPRHLAAGHPAGAARLAKALKSLEAEGWVSLSQVHRPGGGGPLIDQLVIGPGGIVIIDSRAWVGRVEVNRGVVQQNGFWRERETAAVAHAAGCVAALLLPQHRTAVHAVICIAQHDLAEHVVAPGVHVVGVSGLVRALRSLPYRLHPAEVLHLNTMLRHTLVEGAVQDQLTTAELDALPGQLPGAHRDPSVTVAAPGLFVPLGSGALRFVARSAARRGRPAQPWWRSPRVLVPRVLLAVLLMAAGVLLGPSIVHSFSGSVSGAPAVTVLPSSSEDAAGSPPPSGSSPGTEAASPSATPRPAESGSRRARGSIVAPIWSGGASPVEPIPPAAATAMEQPLASLGPITPPGYRSAGSGASPPSGA